jgi:hypothetical protein
MSKEKVYNGYKVSVLQDKNVPKMVGCTIINTTEPCA